MKALKILISICLLAVLGASAQIADEKESASGVEVLSFNWKYEGYAPVEIIDGQNSPLTTSVARSRAYVFKYKAQMVVKNRDEKTIKAINWDYVFLDPEKGKELKRYKVQTKQQILPAESQTLTKDFALDPRENTRHVTTGRQKVQITRIEFADGTIWRRP